MKGLSLKLSKKVHILQFCPDFTKKPKSVKATYIYASERPRYALSENGIVYCAMTWDISVWSWIILLNFCWVSIFFDILITNISWTVAQTPINHSIFWKRVMRNFKCIYLHCFNRLRFLAEISTKLLKLHFLKQFTDHNSDSGRKHGN